MEATAILHHNLIEIATLFSDPTTRLKTIIPNPPPPNPNPVPRMLGDCTNYNHHYDSYSLSLQDKPDNPGYMFTFITQSQRQNEHDTLFALDYQPI
jgi:hypothetical protein